MKAMIIYATAMVIAIHATVWMADSIEMPKATTVKIEENINEN